MILREKQKRFRPGGLKEAGQAGFTLIELMAVSFLLVGMSFLVLPTLARAKQKTIETSCQFNLRQIGLALQTYASANADFLPGPVFGLVDPRYDAGSTNQLAWYVAQQVGSPGPSSTRKLAPGLLCPARESLSPQCRANYVLNDGRSAQPSLPGAPFGQPIAPMANSLTLSMIASATTPAMCFAVADADKGNVNPTLPGWNGLPYQPIHGKFRNQLFFDWHVASKRW